MSEEPRDPLLSEIERRRLDKSTDNTQHTPEQILMMALDDLRSGDIEANACFVILIKKTAGSNEAKTNRYRCGLMRAEEIAFLELSRSYVVEDWKR